MKTAVTRTRGSGQILVRKYVMLILFVTVLCLTAGAVGDVPELTIIGPLVPGEPIFSLESNDTIPNPGSTGVFTTDGILHFYLPNGSEQFTARESNARNLRFISDDGMSSLNMPATRVLIIKEPSVFSQKGQHTLAVINTAKFQKVITLHDEVNVSSPVTYLIGDGSTGFTQLTEVDGNLMIVDGYHRDQSAETG